MDCVKKCPACDSSNSKVAVRLTGKNEEKYFQFSKVKFNGLLDKWLASIPPIILQCKNCSHCWYQFQPDDDQLKDMYNCSKSLQKQEVCSTKTASFIKRELQSLKKLKNNKSLKFLDYGSGSGRWALAALNAGFRVTAFEPNYTRCTNDACSLRLVHLFQDISGSKFNIVNLNQVLEHTKNPFQILKNISKLCIESIIIRITVPNILRSHEGTKIWDL
jgi:2-polyprenyl-3-methyl-5-hydroxy-6-metoxy-1,4-benzoquinol methylase